MINRTSVFTGIFGCRRQEALVYRSCRDRAGIHQCNRGNLSFLNLRALAIREITGGMANGECIVCRCVARAEARSAECGLDDRSGADQIREHAILRELHINRSAGRVDAHSEIICADEMAAQNIRSIADILKSAACAARDYSLVYQQLSVVYFILQRIRNLTVQRDLCAFLDVVQDIHQIGIHFLNGISIARMERHCDHRPDF